MANDIESAKILVQWLIPQLKVPGLQLEDVGFDWFRQSYTVALKKDEQSATLILPIERIEQLRKEEPFALRHLRKQVEGALSLDEQG